MFWTLKMNRLSRFLCQRFRRLYSNSSEITHANWNDWENNLQNSQPKLRFCHIWLLAVCQVSPFGITMLKILACDIKKMLFLYDFCLIILFVMTIWSISYDFWRLALGEMSPRWFLTKMKRLLPSTGSSIPERNDQLLHNLVKKLVTNYYLQEWPLDFLI